MTRLSRFFLTILFALALALGVSGSASAEPLLKSPEIGEAPPPVASGTAITAPHDTPRFDSVARDSVPPVPASYVTKNLGWLELSYPPSAAERVAKILDEANEVKAELSDA